MMSEHEFYRKKITQSEYRGKYTFSYDKKGNFLDTEITKVNLLPTYISPFKKRIIKEIKKCLSKLLSEEDVDYIINGPCMKHVFEKLGLKK